MPGFPSLGDYNGDFVHPQLAVGGCPAPEHVPMLVDAGPRSRGREGRRGKRG